MIKRFFDIFVSFVLLILLSPLILIVASLVRIFDKGPILFTQNRVGKDEIFFRLWKFRTMQTSSQDNVSATTHGTTDKRITSVGYILRMLKLDELPQLYNVLRGDMSLVGPRPEVEYFVRLYNERQKRVLLMRPGCVDLTMVKGHIHDAALLEKQKDPEEYYINHVMPQKLEMNLYYVDHCSFLLDIRIIVGVFIELIRTFKF